MLPKRPLLGLALALLCTAPAYGQDPLSARVLFPNPNYYKTPNELGMVHQDITFESRTGTRLTGWFFDDPDSEQLVMVCMGNTGNMSYMLRHAQMLAEHNLDVFLFDYQGFGKSTGTASVSTLLPDALGAFDYLTEIRKCQPANIGVLGISLGSILALAVGSQRAPGAVAVEDVFIPSEHLAELEKSLDDALSRMVIAGVKRLVLPKVDPLATAPKVKCPLFLLHGEDDWLLPPGASIRVAETREAPTRVWFMDDCGHSPHSLRVDEREFGAQLGSYFASTLAANPWNDPTVTFETSPKAEGSDTFPVSLKVTDTSRRPVEVALTDGERFEFVRLWSKDGVEMATVRVPFEPSHAFAVAHRHTAPDGESWRSDLSPLSRSHHDCEAFAALVREKSGDFTVLSFGTIRYMVKEIAAKDWPALEQRLKSIEPIHPAIRPVLGRYLCSVALAIKPADSKLEGEIITMALGLLPDDPDDFYTVGNASIDVGLRDLFVAEAVYRHAKRQHATGDLAETRRLLRYYAKVVPEGHPRHLEADAIDQLGPDTVLP